MNFCPLLTRHAKVPVMVIPHAPYESAWRLQLEDDVHKARAVAQRLAAARDAKDKLAGTVTPTRYQVLGISY